MKATVEQHIKFKKLKMRLRLPMWQVKGVLESIWNFTAQHTPDGGIGAFSNEDICACIEWSDDPDELMQNMIDCGWIDNSETHRLIIHDWSEHCPMYIKGNLARSHRSFALTKEHTKEATKEHTKEASKEHTTKPSLAKPSLAKPKKENNKKKIPTFIPDGFQPSTANIAYAEKHGVDLDDTLDRFKAKTAAEGKQYVDWHAGLSTYLQNAKKWAVEASAKVAVNDSPKYPDFTPPDCSW